MRKKLFWFFFLFILSTSVAVRGFRFGAVPVSLYWDEVAIFVDARAVAQTGLDIYGRNWWQPIFYSYGDYKLPIYIWSSAFFIKILGAHDWVVRLPSLMAGVGSIALVGLLARLLFNQYSLSSRRVLQLSAMAVLGFSPWSIMFSRAGFEGHLAQFLLGLSVLCLVLSRKNKFYLFFASIFGLLATYTYFSVLFVWLGVVVAYWLLIELPYHLSSSQKAAQSSLSNQNKLLLSKLFKSLVIYLVLPIFVYLLGLQFLFRSPFYPSMNHFRLSANSILNTDYAAESTHLRALSENTLLSKFMYHRHVLLTRQLLKNYSTTLSFDFLFLNGDSNLRHGTGHSGLFLSIFAPFLVIGLLTLFAHDRARFLFLLSWWMFALLPACVPGEVPHALRSLNSLIPIVLFMSYGAMKSYEFFLKVVGSSAQSGKLLASVLGSAIVLAGVFQLTSFGYQYFTVYPASSASFWQREYLDLAAAVNQLSSTSQAPIYILPFEGRFFLWLLAYGDYSSAQIQQIYAQEQSFIKLGTASFDRFSGWRSEGYQEVVLVGDPFFTNELSLRVGGKVENLEWLSSLDGSKTFVIDKLSCNAYKDGDKVKCREE